MRVRSVGSRAGTPRRYKSCNNKFYFYKANLNHFLLVFLRFQTAVTTFQTAVTTFQTAVSLMVSTFRTAVKIQNPFTVRYPKKLGVVLDFTSKIIEGSHPYYIPSGCSRFSTVVAVNRRRERGERGADVTRQRSLDTEIT